MKENSNTKSEQQKQPVSNFFSNFVKNSEKCKKIIFADYHSNYMCLDHNDVTNDYVKNKEASYAVIRKEHKSTKSTDDGPGRTEKGTDFPTLKTTSIDTPTGIPLTHRERCQKIIDKAFGTGPTGPDRVRSEQYFSHTVNIEDTKREMEEAAKARIKLQEQNMQIDNPMIPDDRHYGSFKMDRELIKIDNNEDEIKVEEDTTKKAPPADAPTQKQAAPPAFIKKEAEPCTLAVNKELVKSFDMGSAREPHLKIEGFKKTQVTTPLKKPNLDCSKDTVGYSTEFYEDDDADAETVGRGKKDRNPAVNPDHKRVLNVTTAKEKEEKLAQKLETIEETPLVEAQRPEIEGLNVNPKVLGDQLNPALTCGSIYKKQGNSHGGDFPGTLDEVAKRCRNSPLEEIDEMLVKEMENFGLPLTCKPEDKTPSTLMGDELVQMDLYYEIKARKHQKLNSKSAKSEDKDEERGNISKMGPGSIHHMFSQVRLPDLTELAEEKALLKSKDIKPVKEKVDSPHPDHIKAKTKPVSCDNNPTAKLSCYGTSELDEYEDEIEEDHHISPSQKKNMNQTIQKQVQHKYGVPQFGNTNWLQTNVQQIAPKVTAAAPSDKERMQALHSSPGLNNRNAFVKNTEVKNRTHTAEAIKPAINPKNVSSYHPVSPASGNIGTDWLFKPEYNSNYKGVRRPSHDGTINASDSVEHDQRLLAEREVENKNSFYSRYLSSTYARGQVKEPTATKVRNENELHFDEADEVKCHDRTPVFQPKRMEEQAVLDKRRDAAIKLVEGVPNTKISFTDQKWYRNIENSPNEDKVIQPCSNKLHSDEDSECKLNLEPEKVTLPEELMKEHELDPYCVLTCNETCPISPSMPACRNTDFVDTSDTIYMKKNICESLRPKPTAKNLITPFENVMADTQAHLNENVSGSERPKVDVKSLKSQYQNLIVDTPAKDNDNKNISKSVQPKQDATPLVTPQCVNVPADTQVQRHKVGKINFQLIPENLPEAKVKELKEPTVVPPENLSLANSQQVTLTELLRRVRERNRRQFISDLGVKVDPTEGNRQDPRCTPTAPRFPPSNPIPPPSIGLPMVKRKLEIFKPKYKGSDCSKKCAACDIDVTCGVQLGEICPEIACELNEAEACAAISRVDLTEVVFGHIQALEEIVGGVLRQVKSNVETLLAREYDPWSPIPSWPSPKKVAIQYEKWTHGISGAPPCVRGCPVFPKTRASMNPEPPCNLKPCEGFPKRRSFSALDCFAVFLGKNKVYDLGRF